MDELKSQQDIWRRSNADAEQRATHASDDDAARAALGEKLRGERVLGELSEQYESQQTQLDEMSRKQSQITATLERLSSQRDVLNARLKVARAQIRMAGGKAQATRSTPWLSQVRWRNVGMLACVLLVVGGSTKLLIELASRTSTPGFASATIEVHTNEELDTANTLETLYFNPPKAFGLPFLGCDKNVISLAVSPTGTHVAAATGGSTVFVWDAESGKLLHRLSDNLSEVNTLAFSPDGRLLVTGEAFNAAESSVKFWDPQTGTRLGGLSNEKSFVSRISFSPNGSLLACGYFGKSGQNITVWDSQTRAEVWSIPFSESVDGLTFNSDGTLLAATSDRSETFIWDIKERKLLKTWFANSSGLDGRYGPLFQPDGSGLFVNHKLWNARTGERLSQMGGLLQRTKSGALSNDGRFLAMASGEWTAVVDSQTGLARTLLPGHQTNVVAMSPQGDRLFTGGGAPYVIRWDLNSPSLVGRGPSQEIVAGPLLATARDKPLCLVNVGKAIGVWNHETRSPLMSLKTDSPPEVSQSVAAFSPGARRAAVFDVNGLLQVWDVVSGDRVSHARIPEASGRAEEPQRQLTFSTDSDSLWVATAAQLWKLDVGKSAPEPWIEWPNGTQVTSLSPDGQIAVAVTKQPRMLAWEISSRQPIPLGEEFHQAVQSLAFTQDGRRLLGSSVVGELLHWDFERRKLLSRFRVGPNDSGASQRLAFLPDRRHFLEVRSSVVRLIDVETHQQRLQFGSDPSDSNQSVADRQFFSSSRLEVTYDGRMVVTDGKSRDRLAFWNLYLHQQLGKESADWQKRGRK
ncbi:MAG: hypothetical protein NT013_09840 [Planctomycetia bacterium]|nr:hypothetical protein [Planctomycetia bacterium]